MKISKNKILNKFIPTKSIQESKKEWIDLAKENDKYYIVSKKGTKITDDEFRQTGEENYNEIVINDTILQERLKPLSDKKVLDIGCGIGRLSEFFAKDFKEVEGIDISDEMIKKAKERLSNLNNVNFTATDGVHYPFSDNYFDLVFSYIVFQHMPSEEIIEENFKEALRVLKPNGIIKIQIRGGYEPNKKEWFYSPVYTEKKAKALIQRIGLKTIKTGDDSIKRFWLWLEK